MCGSHLHHPQYVFMAWNLVKHRGKFTFTEAKKVKETITGCISHNIIREAIERG
jgi:hypothetical protein